MLPELRTRDNKSTMEGQKLRGLIDSSPKNQAIIETVQ